MSRSAPLRRGDAKRQAERRQRLLYAAVAIGVVALAVLIAVLSTGESGDAIGLDELAGDPAIVGSPLTPAPQDPTGDPEVGNSAPRIEGAAFDGTPTVVGGSASPQLVTFMAAWCPACQEELPELVSWLEEGRLPDDVELTTVITGLDPTRPNWPPDAWLVEEGYDGQVLVDDAEGSAAQAYGLTATPFWVALDADGRVVTRAAGMLDAGQLDLLAEMARTGG